MALAHPAHADDSNKLILTLDVQPDFAPGQLCILSRYNSCKDNECGITRVSSIESKAATGTGQYLLTGYKGADPNITSLVNGISTRAREKADRCDSNNLLCAPAIDLRVKDKNTQITCSPLDGSLNPRIAFVSLVFVADDTKQPGVIDVKLTGTTATLSFQSKLNRKIRTTLQVIGGDYAPEATTRIGFNETVALLLVPRCRRVVAELPGFPKGEYIANVTSDATDKIHNGTCMGTVAQQTLSLYLPVTTESELKTISISHTVSDASRETPPAIAKATWSTALPSAPFRLQAHSFSFSWATPTGCNSEKWPSKAAWHDPERQWTANCPRARLFDGSACVVSEHHDRCDYACTVTSPAEAVSFPTPIRFERMRWAEGNTGKALANFIYSWMDTLLYSGQTLASHVSSEERRVMLEFESPEKWRAKGGIQFDEVRLVSPDGNTSSQLFSQQAAPPRWTALRMPGACIRTVALAVFGSAVFDETLLPVHDGVVMLEEPQRFRRKSRLDLEFGAVYQTQSGLRDGQPGVGGGLQLSYEPARPMSIGVFAGVHLTRKSFVALDRGADADDQQVGIWRLSFGGVIECFWRRRLRFFARGGVQLDSSLRFSDDDKLGVLSKSYTTETGVLLEVIRRRTWLSMGIGLDLDVEHHRFQTDFLGAPTTTTESRAEPFFALRLRWRLR